MWVYRHIAGRGYTVGFYEPKPPTGSPPFFVQTESYDNQNDARKAVNYLNGGTGAPPHVEIRADDPRL